VLEVSLRGVEPPFTAWLSYATDVA
jgi:hypothetical protein